MQTYARTVSGGASVASRACTWRTSILSQRATLTDWQPLRFSQLLSCPTASSGVDTARLNGTALQVTLPPIFTWGNDSAQLCEQISWYRDTVCRAGADAASLQCLVLRLFPDGNLARLAVGDTQTSFSPSSNLPSSSLRAWRRRGRCTRAFHETPLAVFAESPQPWGSGLDVHDCFAQAIRTLEAVTASVGPLLPLLIVLPTRMLVTQTFCDLLFAALARVKVCNIALELPSTHILASSEIAMEQGGGDKRRGGEDCATSWCDLSTLTTDWETLRRHYGFKALRYVAKNDVLPLHVLVPWLLHTGLLASYETGLVVDTIPLRLGSVPSSQQARTLDETNLYMSESCTHQTTGNSVELTDALRTSILNKGGEVTASATGGSGNSTETLANAEVALRHQLSRRTKPQHKEVDPEGFLSLDVPSDAFRELVLASVVPDKENTEAERCELLSQFGSLMLHTLSSGASRSTDAAAGDMTQERKLMERRERAPGEDDAASAAALEKEADELLQRLQRRTTDDFATMQRKMQNELNRCTAARIPGSPAVHVTSTSSSIGEEKAALMPARVPYYGRGYWDHMKRFANRTQAAYAMSMPTLHSAQVQEWTRQLRGALMTASSQSEYCQDAPSLPVLPTTVPVLAPADLECLRLQREGHLRREAGVNDDGEAESLAHWLPFSVEQSMAKALKELPSEHVTTVKDDFFASYKNGAVGSTGSTIVMPSTSLDGEDGDAVVIKKTAAPRPFWYFHPQQVSDQYERRVKEASGKGSTEAAANLIREVDEAFEQEVMLPCLHQMVVDTVSDAATAQRSSVVAIALQAPGLSEEGIARTWTTVS